MLQCSIQKSASPEQRQCIRFLSVTAVVVGVTSCCRPVWWATLQFSGLWLPWCIMVMASFTASGMTGEHMKRAFTDLKTCVWVFGEPVLHM